MHSLFLNRDRITDWRVWLPTAVEVAVLLLLVVQASRLAWMLLAQEDQPAPTQDTVDEHAPVSRLPPIDVFFPRTTASGALGGAGEALGYTLFGVRIGSGAMGSAILGHDGKQASHAVGSEVAPGIVLESVGIDYAVLTSGGALHRLALRRTKPATAPPPSSLLSGANASQLRGSVSATPAAPVSSSSPTPGVGQPDPSASERGIGASQLLEASGLAAAAGPMARLPGGTNALLRVAGLRPDDKILSVEGQPVDPTRLQQLSGQLDGKSQVTIEYLRDGQTHTTTLKAPR